MDRNELYGLVFKAQMSELEVWAVYREDRYETVLGDGFYIYLDAAFLTCEKAEEYARSARAKNSKDTKYGLHYYLYRITLCLEPRNYDVAVKDSTFIEAFDDAYRKDEVSPKPDDLAICLRVEE